MCKRPDCPAKANCKHGWIYDVLDAYPAAPCHKRHRNGDGIFVCSGFEEKELVTLDKLPDPDIELFPEHDYARPDELP